MSATAIETISLNINGANVTVKNPSTSMCLADFLRDSINLKGTKLMCREGACGSCMVMISKKDPKENPNELKTVNSCLLPLVSLDGMFIITIEQLGNYKKKLCNIQKHMIEKFGMQCGFCTSGMIINGMGAIMKSSGEVSDDPRKFFDGNICRCTGYRPIMDAMICSAKDDNLNDIEDMCSLEPKRGKAGEVVQIDLRRQSTETIARPADLKELLKIVTNESYKSVNLMAGNTGSAIYKEKAVSDLTIILDRVQEFQKIEVDQNTQSVAFGASVTLAEMIETLKKFDSMSAIANHLFKIGNHAVRNVGTWSGNLMLLHHHHEFPSDVYILLELADAILTLIDFGGNIVKCTLKEFLELDMKRKIIQSVCLNIFSTEDCVRTYKVMPRHQNCYAYVHAAFKGRIDKETSKLKDVPTLIFGALGRKPIRAIETERHMKRMKDDQVDLNNNNCLQECLQILEKEINPSETMTGPSKMYRKRVAINLFYKFYLSLLGDKLSQENKSAIGYVSPSYHAKQTFRSREEKFPLTKPINRLDSDLLVSGKTEYANDIPKFKEEVFAAFVLAGKATATFVGVDVETVKDLPGFIDVLTFKDIPGANKACMDIFDIMYDPILCDGEIQFAGQPVAIVVADTQKHADDIAQAVKVITENEEQPVIELERSIQERSFFPEKVPPVIVGDTTRVLENCEKVIEGQLKTHSMHHFYIEPQTCVVVPREKEVEVFSSTQFAASVQQGVAEALGIQSHKVFVTNQKCGGAFGGKIRASSQVAMAAAIAANALDRPVRMALDYNTDMQLCGARASIVANYKVGFTSEGYLQAIELEVYIDAGFAPLNVEILCVPIFIDNAYYCPNWKLTMKECKTNKPPNTHVRGPGSSQAKFIIESIMDHIATHLGKSPEAVREMNFYQNGQVLKPFQVDPMQSGRLENTWNEIILKSDFNKRQAAVELFNKNNRWHKRGICLMPLLYRHGYLDFHFTASMSILYSDGTVVVYHGGTEMGQGINTRMAQLAAKYLNIPLDLVSIGSTSTRTAANSGSSSASVASEQVGMAVIQCCEMLLDRLKPIREEYPNCSWKELIKICHKKRIDLSVTSMYNDKTKFLGLYSNYSAACSEVEVDILTGETTIIRTDMLFDSGESINPSIDIGQLEGAFVMGIGQFLQERIIFDPVTGRELTAGTWNYFPPLAKDIPCDFRVYLAEESTNVNNPFGSKAVGEPAVGLAASCLLAAKRAVAAARADNGDRDHLTVDAPATIDQLQGIIPWSLERLTV